MRSDEPGARIRSVPRLPCMASATVLVSLFVVSMHAILTIAGRPRVWPPRSACAATRLSLSATMTRCSRCAAARRARLTAELGAWTGSLELRSQKTVRRRGANRSTKRYRASRSDHRRGFDLRARCAASISFIASSSKFCPPHTQHSSTSTSTPDFLPALMTVMHRVTCCEPQ